MKQKTIILPSGNEATLFEDGTISVQDWNSMAYVRMSKEDFVAMIGLFRGPLE